VTGKHPRWHAFVWMTVGFLQGALTVLYLNGSSSDEVLARWKQPRSVDYGSFDPYTVFIVAVGKRRSFFLERATHEVRVMHGDDPNTYGHVVEISLDLGLYDASFVQRSKVSWTGAGVEIEVPTGHRLFLPKAAFIGGR
jgi:hypothetical protein